MAGESAAAFEKRLRREGNWDEFAHRWSTGRIGLAKKERSALHKQLKAAYPPPAKQSAPPKPPKPSILLVPLSSFKRHQTGVGHAVQWAAQNIDNEDVTPGDSLGPLSWTVLSWARLSPDLFWTSLYGKMVRPRSKQVEEVDDKTPAILKLIDDLKREYLPSA